MERRGEPRVNHAVQRTHAALDAPIVVAMTGRLLLAPRQARIGCPSRAPAGVGTAARPPGKQRPLPPPAGAGHRPGSDPRYQPPSPERALQVCMVGATVINAAFPADSQRYDSSILAFTTSRWRLGSRPRVRPSRLAGVSSAGAVWLFDLRSRKGLKVRHWDAISDRRKAAKPRFLFCGRTISPSTHVMCRLVRLAVPGGCQPDTEWSSSSRIARHARQVAGRQPRPPTAGD